MSPVDLGEEHPALGAADAAALRQGRAWCVCVQAAQRTKWLEGCGEWGCLGCGHTNRLEPLCSTYRPSKRQDLVLSETVSHCRVLARLRHFKIVLMFYKDDSLTDRQ